LAQHELGAASLESHGASPGVISGVFRLACLTGAASGEESLRQNIRSGS
jgi:hypothetical protein